MPVRTPITINMSSIPVKGAGGLGLLAMVLLMAAAIPAARWMLIGSLLAGAVAAALVIYRHRSHGIGAPGGDQPMGLDLHPDPRPRREPPPPGHLLPRLATR